MYQEIEGQRPVIISRNHNKRIRPPIYRWTMPPDYDPNWNNKRAVIVGGATGVFAATWMQIYEPVRDLLHYYQAPDNLKQLSIFAREVTKMENFRRGFLGKLSFYATYGMLFETARWSLWKNITCGYPYNKHTINVAFTKHLLTALAVGALTSWIPVPFYNIGIRFQQDQILPRELARGYRNPLHAAFQIIRYDGLYPLFRSAGPLMAEFAAGTGAMFFTVDFLKDKARLMRTYNYDVPMFPDLYTKPLYVLGATYMGLWAAFPFKSLRFAVDDHPKNSKGELLFSGYAEAWWKLAGDNFQMQQLWNGFHQQFFRAAPPLFLTIWFADSLGMLDQHEFAPIYVD